MYLLFLRANSAWAVMCGSTMTDIDGCYLWNDKAALIAALAEKGLRVDPSNVIY